jgi:GTPase
MTEARRCGYVAILGAPNAGKSTLLNRLVGSKVSIVSPKVQTTRARVLGIVLRGPAQIVFIDTPGIFASPKRRLERAMVKAAWAGAADADAVVVLVDAARGFDPDSERIIDGLRTSAPGRHVLLALNKIDRVAREKLLPLADDLNRRGKFERIFMISSTTGDGVDDLADYLAGLVPEGPWLFPEDQVSDVPLRLLAAELVREQVFLQLHEELPYAITVETDQWEERKDGSVRIDMTIHVARESHKPIVLGKGGAQVKRIGEKARRELEALLERRVHLFLHVRVTENWADDRERYDAIRLEWEK